MGERNYAAMAHHADALLLALIEQNGIGQGVADRGVEIKGLQHTMNEHLHAEIPGTATVSVRIATAGPVVSQDVPMRIMLEMIDDGIKVGMWMVDYDGIGSLHRLPQGYLPAAFDARG